MWVCFRLGKKCSISNLWNIANTGFNIWKGNITNTSVFQEHLSLQFLFFEANKKRWWTRVCRCCHVTCVQKKWWMRNKIRFVSRTHLHNMFCELIFVSNLCSCIFWCEILIGAHVTNIAFDYLGPWAWHWSWFVFLNLVQQCSAKTCLNLLPPKTRWRRILLGKERNKTTIHNSSILFQPSN